MGVMAGLTKVGGLRPLPPDGGVEGGDREGGEGAAQEERGGRWVSIALVELDILEKMANFAGA